MDTGFKISVAIHALLLGAVVVNNPFRSEPLPFDVQVVDVIFAPTANESSAPEPEPESEPQPEVVTEIAMPQVELLDEPPEPEPPQPDIEPAVAQSNAQMAPPTQEPEIAEPEAPPAPPPVPEPVEVDAPEAEEAVPEQADRIADEVVIPEEPAPAEPEEIAPQEGIGEPEPEVAEREAAPEASTTEIVTEADIASSAPKTSIRPPPRRPAPPPPPAPARQAEASEQEPEPQPETPRQPAETASQEENIPLGPPLSGGEREGLRVAVSRCWNVGSLSSEAQETKITLFVAMGRDGRPDVGSIRMVDHSGGSAAAARRVFETARRAVIRCGMSGFPLPAEKYGQWKEIEMTFNPEGMFWR